MDNRKRALSPSVTGKLTPAPDPEEILDGQAITGIPDPNVTREQALRQIEVALMDPSIDKAIKLAVAKVLADQQERYDALLKNSVRAARARERRVCLDVVKQAFAELLKEDRIRGGEGQGTLSLARVVLVSKLTPKE